MRFPKLFGFGGGPSVPAPTIPETYDLDQVVYAIGDIHGRSDLLDLMLQKITADAKDSRSTRPVTVVFLGDYIDRGPNSAKVIEDLATLGGTPGVHLVFLMGNHERAMLDFMSNPSKGRRWLGMGGFQTLKSYGVRPVHPGASDDDMMECADALIQKVGPCKTFLREKLDLYHVIGNVMFVHAAAQPDLQVDEQSEAVLLWGNNDFMRYGGPSDYWVVHGHTISDNPERHLNRIGVDTGAYISGILSAARIDADGVRFIQVSA